MAGNTKESGRKTAGMGGGLRDTPIITLTSGRSRMGKHMGKGCISGSMGRYMTGSGRADLNTGMGSGQARMDAILT
jgi:hypothetical protein